MTKFHATITLALILSMSWITPAMAYIDPGSGSAIMSAVMGFFVAAGIAIKTYWYKIKSIFSGSKTEQVDDNSNDDSK
jgi:hypothetical protein